MISTTAAILALLISASATYNAYRLRGGKLAWSEILIAFSMIFFTISMVLNLFLTDPKLFNNVKVSEIFFILGFIFLFTASLKLRFSLK